MVRPRPPDFGGVGDPCPRHTARAAVKARPRRIRACRRAPSPTPAMRAAREQAREQRAAAAARRARPGARERRRASREAYTDLSRREAIELAQTPFPEFDRRGYTALDLPCRPASSRRVAGRAARGSRVRGRRTSSWRAQLPLRTLGANGAPTPVDLSLRGDASDGFAPLAPIVTLDDRRPADAGLTLDDIGVTVTPIGVDERRRRRAPGQGVLPRGRTGHRPLGHAAARGRGPRRAAALAGQPGALPLALRPGGRCAPAAELRPAGAEIIAADGTKLAQSPPRGLGRGRRRRSRPRSRVERATTSSSTSSTAADVRYPIMLDPTILEDSAHWFSNVGHRPISRAGSGTDPTATSPTSTAAAYLGNGMYTYNRGSQGRSPPATTPTGSSTRPARRGSCAPTSATSSTSRRPPAPCPRRTTTTASYQGVWSYTYNRYETGTWCEPADRRGAVRALAVHAPTAR